MYNEERQAYEQMYGEMIGLRAKIYDALGWNISDEVKSDMVWPIQ